MYCSKCGTQLEDGSRFCPNCGGKFGNRSIIKIASIVLLLVVIAGFATYIGYQQMRISKLNQKLEEAVGKNAGYTEIIVKVESEATAMTYAELFRLCDKSIEDRTSLVAELRGLYPDIESDLRQKLIEFLNAENELVRQKRAFYRKQLELSSSLDSLVEHIKDKPRSSYGWEYYEQRSAKLKGKIRETSLEMTKEASHFIDTYKALVEREREIETEMKKAGIRFVAFFQQYADQNIKFAEDAKVKAGTLGL